MRHHRMTHLDLIHVIAGIMITMSLLLSQVHHPAWLLLTGFVGLNLFQFGFTGFCPMKRLLEWVLPGRH